MESSAQDQTLKPAEHMTGECMCGKVKFEVDQPLIGAALCYCKTLPAPHRIGRLGHRTDPAGLVPDH